MPSALNLVSHCAASEVPSVMHITPGPEMQPRFRPHAARSSPACPFSTGCPERQSRRERLACPASRSPHCVSGTPTRPAPPGSPPEAARRRRRRGSRRGSGCRGRAQQGRAGRRPRAPARRRRARADSARRASAEASTNTCPGPHGTAGTPPQQATRREARRRASWLPDAVRAAGQSCSFSIHGHALGHARTSQAR